MRRPECASWAILAVIAVLFWWKPIEKKPFTNTSSDASGADNNLKQLLTNQKAWLLTAFFGLMAFMFYTIMAWLPPIVEDMDFSKQQLA